MAKDLTSSLIDRKKVLNNNEAIKEIYNQIGFRGVLVDGKYRFTKNQIAQFFEIINGKLKNPMSPTFMSVTSRRI